MDLTALLTQACAELDERRQSSLDLWREYVGWRLCRGAMDAVRQALGSEGIAAQAATVLMENALMFTLLDVETPRPFDLLLNLDDAALDRGLDCIDATAPAPRIRALVRDALALAATGEREALLRIPWPGIRVDEDGTLGVDDFSLSWSRPVARAFAVVAAKLPAPAALECLLRAALRYDAIFASTRHIGPPQAVYDAFYAWGVRNEGFASPFNARLLAHEGTRFFSAFPDTDGVFGSRGSFFSCDPADWDGHWCLDPPFLPETMARVDVRIAAMRGAADAPSILLVVPMSHTPANVPDETVVLQAGVHVVEGLGDSFFTLPVDVGIHRYGEFEGFDAATIEAGYRRPDGADA